MELTVLVERVGTNGYTVRDPFGRTANGATADEAVASLRAALATHPGQLVGLIVPGDHPLVKWAGTWENDPYLDEYRRAVEQFRQGRDADPDAL